MSTNIHPTNRGEEPRGKACGKGGQGGRMASQIKSDMLVIYLTNATSCTLRNTKYPGEKFPFIVLLSFSPTHYCSGNRSCKLGCWTSRWIFCHSNYHTLSKRNVFLLKLSCIWIATHPDLHYYVNVCLDYANLAHKIDESSFSSLWLYLVEEVSVECRRPAWVSRLLRKSNTYSFVFEEP